MMDLQIFAEKSLSNQTSNALRKGIKSLQKMIDEHLAKIENPQSFYPDWDSRSDAKKIGDMLHWNKEIHNFEESIQNRIDELKSRGESYE